MSRNKFAVGLLLAGLVGLVPESTVRAAAISWGAPFEFVTEDDLDLTFGPVVYAQNGGDNIGNEAFIPVAVVPTLPDPKPVTVGGTTIEFQGIEAVYGEDASFGMIGFPFETFGDAVDHLPGQSFDVTFDILNARTFAIPQVVFDPAPATLFDPLEEPDYSIATGNAELDSILDSQVFMDSRNSLGAGSALADSGTLVIQLNNLMVGNNYQVQIIGGADDRAFANDPNVIDPTYMATSTSGGLSPIGTLSDGLGNQVSNVGAFLDLDGDAQGHVTSVLGQFTADATAQTVNFHLQRGRNAGISAIILTEEAASPNCDFNNDNVCNGADIDLLVAAIQDPQSDPLFDLNGDGTVDATDVTDSNSGWLAIAGGENSDVTDGNPFLLGDANLDGTVDVSDFNAWNAAKFTDTPQWTSGDFNADGTVDVSDFNLWNGNKFTRSGGPVSVPEPHISLLAAGGLACAIRRRFLPKR